MRNGSGAPSGCGGRESVRRGGEGLRRSTQHVDEVADVTNHNLGHREGNSNARVRGKPGARADLAYYTCVLGYHASSMWGGLFGTSATMHGACMDYEAMLRVGE